MPLQLGRDRAFDPTNRAFSNDSPKAEVFLFFVFGKFFFLERSRVRSDKSREVLLFVFFSCVWGGRAATHECV